MFLDYLSKKNIKPEDYLRMAKRFAKEEGYDPKLLKFSNNPKKKLEYMDIDFGQVGYNDFIIYLLSDTKEVAMKKRKAYLARATKIKGSWANDVISPNYLAINVLWAGNLDKNQE